MGNTPDLVAKIRLLSTKQGGRSGPTPGGKLNCIMVFGARNFDARLQLDAVGPLQPGQEALVPISFYDPECAKDFVAVGQTFKLREVNVIGEGVIVEVTAIGGPEDGSASPSRDAAVA